MGTWGAEILDDDLAQDVRTELIEMMTTTSAAAAFTRLLRKYSDLDEDEKAVLYLAIAATIMDEDADCPEALQRARKIMDNGAGLAGKWKVCLWTVDLSRQDVWVDDRNRRENRIRTTDR